MEHVFAIIALGILCALWVYFQRWIAGIDPRLADLKRGGCGGCVKDCQRDGE